MSGFSLETWLMLSAIALNLTLTAGALLRACQTRHDIAAIKKVMGD